MTAQMRRYAEHVAAMIDDHGMFGGGVRGEYIERDNNRNTEARHVFDMAGQVGQPGGEYGGVFGAQFAKGRAAMIF